jgi:hypothetical protein
MKTSPTSKGHYLVAKHLKVLMSSLGHYPNKVSCAAIAETLDASLLEKGVLSRKKLNGINNQSKGGKNPIFSARQIGFKV